MGALGLGGTTQTHEVRATFCTIGSLIVVYMALRSLWQVLAGWYGLTVPIRR